MNLFDRNNYPLSEPRVLTIGDRWTWKRTDLGVHYPPSLYSLSYVFRSEDGDSEIEIAATEVNTDYIVEVSQSSTAGYASGTYRWQGYITRTSDSERISIGRGTVEVLPDPDTDGTDQRSHVKKVLDALEAMIEGKASLDQLSYSIAGRSISRLSPQEAIAWRNKYLAYYRAELAMETGGTSGRRVRVRFRR